MKLERGILYFFYPSQRKPKSSLLRKTGSFLFFFLSFSFLLRGKSERFFSLSQISLVAQMYPRLQIGLQAQARTQVTFGIGLGLGLIYNLKWAWARSRASLKSNYPVSGWVVYNEFLMIIQIFFIKIASLYFS